MNRNVKWIWAAALLLSPLAASAQSPKTDPGAAPPAVAPAAPADDDDGMWLADLFGAGDALESAFDTPDPAPVALGEIGDTRAVGPLVMLLKNIGGHNRYIDAEIGLCCMNEEVAADAGRLYPVGCEKQQDRPLVALWQANDGGRLPHPQLVRV